MVAQVQRSITKAKKIQQNFLISVKVVDACWICSTELSDTFRSLFVYGKEQES